MSKERLIVEAYGLPMDEAIGYALKVVVEGRISDGGYCYLTVFTGGAHTTQVAAFQNKASDRLVVTREAKAPPVEVPGRARYTAAACPLCGSAVKETPASGKGRWGNTYECVDCLWRWPRITPPHDKTMTRSAR